MLRQHSVPNHRLDRRLTKGTLLEAMPMEHDPAPSHGLGALDLSHRAKMEILFAILLGLFLGALLHLEIGAVIIGVYCAAILSLIGSVSAFIKDMNLALRAVRLEVKF